MGRRSERRETTERRRLGRWPRRLLLAGLAGIVALLALAGVGYALTDIPKPSAGATATATRILYSDRSEMGRVGTENRIPVGLSQVPLHVQQAVLAAEDRGFYTEPGISLKGIGRALFTNIRGGGSVQQGGSTITQQYAKNAFLTSERTYTRKVKEVFIALKMTRTLSKQTILEDYLNTIYFGRQAAGIQVATKSYFGGQVEQLSVSQGALLAAVIRSPSSLDPAKHPEAAKARWAFVLDGMVKKGWLSQADRDAQTFPFVLQPGQGPRNNDLSGPKGHVISQVLDELSRKGFDEARLSAGGLVVTTTIRREAQDAAIKAVQERTGPNPKASDLQGALVSIKPGTGEVWAYYGGSTGTGFDFASNGDVGRPPGSSFKPYVLATALSQGTSLSTRLDGNSPKTFSGAARPINNFGGQDYGRSITLLQATQNSVNTAYFELGQDVGPAAVAELAHAAGIPASTKLVSDDGVTNGSIALGAYDVQVIDQAVGYATFANRGVPTEPFLVKRVDDRKGSNVYAAEIVTGPAAYSQDVAADATYAMQQVVERGTARGARLSGGREAAGKTGTTQYNEDVWFCGFTPQLATAVWFGYAQKKTIDVGGGQATGGGVAAPVWKSYMDAALTGVPNVDFPPRANVGTAGRGSGGSSFTPRPRPRRSVRPRPPSSDTSGTPDATQAPTSPETAAATPQPTVRPRRSPAPPEPAPSPAGGGSGASPGSGTGGGGTSPAPASSPG